jgi:hypothetical protein
MSVDEMLTRTKNCFNKDQKQVLEAYRCLPITRLDERMEADIACWPTPGCCQR